MNMFASKKRVMCGEPLRSVFGIVSNRLWSLCPGLVCQSFLSGLCAVLG